MFAHKPASVACVEESLPADVKDVFLKNLRRAAAPLALSSRAALGYTTATGTYWVVTSDACPCSRDAGHAPGRQSHSLELSYKEHSAGKITVCGDASAPPAVAATLCHLAVVTLRQIELEQENVQLRLQGDMETAARIQKTLLLGRPQVEIPLLASGDAITIPSLQIGGDFYDFFAYNNVLDVIVGDVMGKGIPAALLGAATKNHFLRAINNLMASQPGQLPEPKEVLAIVNAELFKQLAGMETFVTLVYARFEGNKREVQIIDCGHTKTVQALGREDKSNLLMGKNMPLGFSRVDIYEAITRPFDSGDVFFFYSDGVTEAKDPTGEDFGESRLADLVRSLKRLNPQQMVEKIGAEVRTFAASPNPRDDITCVAVKILDMDATRASTRGSLEISSDKTVLPRVREFMRDLCRENFQMAVTEEDLAKLEPAVVDTVRNIIHHAYEDMPDGKIRLEASLFVNRFSIRIYHRGEPFDPETAPATFRGPHVDTVRYSRAKNGEHCVLLQTILKH